MTKRLRWWQRRKVKADPLDVRRKLDELEDFMRSTGSAPVPKPDEQPPSQN